MELHSGRRHSLRTAALLYGVAIAFISGLHLATTGMLGFHTDEFYYLDCGRHPAFGYVDFPPIVPLLARLETGLLGVTPWTLRLLPAILSGVGVGLLGAYVRRLGGSLGLQGIALVVGIAAPYIVGSGDVFQTVIFDLVTWMVAVYWFLCVVVDQRPRYWIYLGITLGIGLEVKYTIVGLIAGITIAVLLTPSLRKQLWTRYPWIAAGIAILLWAPNLTWQVLNGFPTITYITNHRGSGGGVGIYLIEFGLYVSLLLPLWIAGMISFFRSRLLRPVGIACAIPLILFLFVGKSYYAAGTIPVVMAQGLMALSRIGRARLRSTLRVAVVVASALSFVALAQLILPITPASRLHATGLDTKSEVFADSVGWDDVARQVSRMYGDLPASERAQTVIISAYYGVPGALEVYGDPNLLPVVISPQLSDYYWLPPHLAATGALMIDYQPSDVAWMCVSPQLIGHLTVPYQVQGLEQGAPVTFCQLKAPIPKIWSKLRNFS